MLCTTKTNVLYKYWVNIALDTKTVGVSPNGRFLHTCGPKGWIYAYIYICTQMDEKYIVPKKLNKYLSSYGCRCA